MCVAQYSSGWVKLPARETPAHVTTEGMPVGIAALMARGERLVRGELCGSLQTLTCKQAACPIVTYHRELL